MEEDADFFLEEPMRRWQEADARSLARSGSGKEIRAKKKKKQRRGAGRGHAARVRRLACGRRRIVNVPFVN